MSSNPQAATGDKPDQLNAGSKPTEEIINEKQQVTSELHLTETTEKGDILEVSDYTEEQYKRVKRKADFILMPLMLFMDGIQLIDKTSISIQALFQMREDTGLVGQQFQWLTTIFYLTFLIGQFPSNYLMQRWKLGLSLTLYMFGWGTALICVSAANNWAQLMALRALQGFFECSIKPGFLLLTAAWYRTEEHSSRTILWQSSEGLAAIVCNLSLYGIARHASGRDGIAAWRCVSLFLGSLTLAGAVVSFFVLGAPHEVRWLTKDEKRIASARVVTNNAGHDETGKKWNWSQVAEAFKDPQMYFVVVSTFLSNIPNGGITTFSFLMYQTFGFDSYQSMLMSLPRSGIYVVIFIAVAWYTRRFQDQRMWIMIITCILPCIALLVMSLLPNTPEHKWTKWGMFVITVVFSLPIYLGWSLIPSNVAGKTKRSVVTSLAFISYCVGNMGGAQVFRTKDAPRYITGTVACCVCFGLQAFVILAWRFYYMWQNRRRDRIVAASDVPKEEQERRAKQMGENDVTDMQNIYFRYSM